MPYFHQRQLFTLLSVKIFIYGVMAFGPDLHQFHLHKVLVAMTSKELCALKNSALHTHPIKVATASKMMHKLKRECGEDAWQRMSNAIALAQTNKDPAIWFSAISELIKEHEQKEKESQLKEKLAALIEQEKKERILKETQQQANRISENLFRVVPVKSDTPPKLIVVKRRIAR